MKDSEIRKLKPSQQITDNGLVARCNGAGSISWVMAFKINGKYRRHSFAMYPDTSIDEAQARAVSYRRAWKDEGITPKEFDSVETEKREAKKKLEADKAITLRKLLDIYEEDRKNFGRGDAPKTLYDNRQTVLSVWEPFLDRPLQKITSNDILDHYRYWISSQRLSKVTGKPAVAQANKGVRILKALYNFAMTVEELVDYNPALKTSKRITPIESRKYTLLKEESVELFGWLGHVHDKQFQGELIKQGTCTSNDFTPARQIQLDAIGLLMLSGLRRNEVLELAWDSVFLDEQDYKAEESTVPFFHIVTSKQKRDFGVPITKEMWGLLKGRQKQRTNDFVFPSLKKGFEDKPMSTERGGFEIINKIMPKLGKAPRLSANVLRHTFATNCYKILKDYSKVDLMTGHISGRRNTNTSTHVYVHTMAEDHMDWFQQVNAILCGTEDQHGFDFDDIPELTEEEEAELFTAHTGTVRKQTDNRVTLTYE